jgi:hypothetical protein
MVKNKLPATKKYLKDRPHVQTFKVHRAHGSEQQGLRRRQKNRELRWIRAQPLAEPVLGRGRMQSQPESIRRPVKGTFRTVRSEFMLPLIHGATHACCPSDMI